MRVDDGWSDERETVSLQRYEGVPSEPQRPNEARAWKRFVTWALPWLRRKRELADDYLEAEVFEKKAAALNKVAEAELNFANARKVAAETAEITARLDESKAKHLRAESLVEGEINLELLEAMKQEIDRKLEILRLQHGGSVRLLDAAEDAPASADATPSAASVTRENP